MGGTDAPRAQFYKEIKIIIFFFLVQQNYYFNLVVSIIHISFFLTRSKCMFDALCLFLGFKLISYILKVSSWSCMFYKFQVGPKHYLHWNKLVDNKGPMSSRHC